MGPLGQGVSHKRSLDVVNLRKMPSADVIMRSANPPPKK